jgi:KDO2-lipid IV(A) lauroyltransferase
MTREELERRMTVGPTGPPKDSISQGESCIFLAGHCCNWEWLLLYSSLHLAHPYWVAYQPLHNQRIDGFMLKARTRYDAQAIPADDLARRLTKNRKTLKTLALLADQNPGSAENKYWVHFLNQDTAFYEGLDVLARAMNTSVVFVIMKRIKRGHYEVSYKSMRNHPTMGAAMR